MGLEKAIEHGKGHRKQYRGSKQFDSFCRNHKGCPWCEGNRMYSNKKRENEFKAKLNEGLSED